MQAATKKICADRLSRIEGQVRGISRMIDEDRYCIDVLTQIRAVRAALRGVEDAVLKDHVAHCVEGAIASGDGAEQRRKVQELLTVLTQRER
jgi:CsoR family transcriptional regulator, copper-sensing transcriptional repressor